MTVAGLLRSNPDPDGLPPAACRPDTSDASAAPIRSNPDPDPSPAAGNSVKGAPVWAEGRVARCPDPSDNDPGMCMTTRIILDLRSEVITSAIIVEEYCSSCVVYKNPTGQATESFV
jgi:hypothetical protein